MAQNIGLGAHPRRGGEVDYGRLAAAVAEIGKELDLIEFAGYAGRAVAPRTSILGGQGTYLGTIAGAVLLVTMTALITVVNASEGWRSVILVGLILAMLPLSGRDQSR